MATNGYWQDLKDLFKSKQRLKEEEAQKVSAAVDKESEILNRLKQLEEAYQSTVKTETPDFDALFSPVTLDRVKYDLDSDEDIKKAAEEAATAKYASKISEIDKSTVDKLVQAEEKKKQAAETKSATLAQVEELFNSLMEKSKNNSVKRGTQRGSILAGALSEIDDEKASAAAAAEADYVDTAAKLDNLLSDLENQRLSALNELNLKKAVEVSETISSLEKQREKLKADETAKNNAVEKQEATLNAKLQKDKEQYIDTYNKDKLAEQQRQDAYEKANGYSGEKLKSYADRYNIALDFYMSLEPDIAPKALAASANMKYYLGNFYDKLTEVLNSRSSTKTNKYI